MSTGGGAHRCLVTDLTPEGKIRIVEYDPRWPEMFAREAERIRAALGDRALRIEHAGSTAVAGLAAKPVIDVVLVVADSREESAYASVLEAAGHRLLIREPEWYEHRMFKSPQPETNLHVFSRGCPEIERMLLFRDWLRRRPRALRAYKSCAGPETLGARPGLRRREDGHRCRNHESRPRWAQIVKGLVRLNGGSLC